MNTKTSRVSPLSLPLFLAVVLGTGLGLSSTAQADAESDAAHVKYRQSVMGAIGANMGGIGDILKNQLDFPGHIESHARQIAEGSRLIGSAFAKPVTEGATDAKADVWKDRAHFKEDIAELEEAARALESAAASGDPAAIGPAVKALGKTCGGCHESFRKPKEESYKNK